MLVKCWECGAEVSDAAINCPKCGAPVKKQAVYSSSAPKPQSQSHLLKHRKVSVPLFIGIMLMPYIFVWFLLRKGHSKQSKIIGFGWTGLLFLVVMANHQNLNVAGGVSQGASAAIDIDPQRKDKDLAVAMAKQSVPTALKDPSSAEFGNVWGMSASLACGTVNAKNSFGAMTGQTRFIYDGGNVAFENAEGSFAHRWNAVCVDKPRVAPPAGAGELRWGVRPAANLKQIAPTTDEGLAIYVPKAHPELLEGVTVAEQDFSFDHNKLYSADYYIDGEAARDDILKKLLEKYGIPQEYNEEKMNYKWDWRQQKITVRLYYEEAHKRTTVNFSRD